MRFYNFLYNHISNVGCERYNIRWRIVSARQGIGEGKGESAWNEVRSIAESRPAGRDLNETDLKSDRRKLFESSETHLSIIVVGLRESI
jgi:hypothetical protein